MSNYMDRKKHMRIMAIGLCKDIPVSYQIPKSGHPSKSDHIIPLTAAGVFSGHPALEIGDPCLETLPFGVSWGLGPRLLLIAMPAEISLVCLFRHESLTYIIGF